MSGFVEDLRPRERQVALLVAKGLLNKEIGAALSIATSTVKTHVEHAMRRVGARNRAHLAVIITSARPFGWLQAPY